MFIAAKVPVFERLSLHGTNVNETGMKKFLTPAVQNISLLFIVYAWSKIKCTIDQGLCIIKAQIHVIEFGLYLSKNENVA